MGEAALWGLAGASSLFIGAVLGARLGLPRHIIGFILAFGAGTLVSAVAFELTDAAFELGGADVVAIGLALGALAYFAGTLLIGDGGGEGPALLLGAVLDGIPESIVIGISLIAGGGVGVPVLAAVFISNLPEGISTSEEMRRAGQSTSKILRTWTLVCAASAVAAAVGYGAFEGASDDIVGLVDAFAGGAVLTMLSVTMIPDAYNFQSGQTKTARGAVGLLTVLGFALAYLLSTLE